MLYLGIAISLVLLAGAALLFKWISLRLVVRQGAESLTPEDLHVLEQSAAHLVDEIKETAAVAIRDLDDRCEELRKLIFLADQRTTLLSQITKDSEAPIPVAGAQEAGSKLRVYEFADAGLEPSEIARQTSLPVGEITLLLGLRSAARV